MTTPGVEAQMAALRSTVGFSAHAHRWLLGGAATMAVFAVVAWHPVPLMIAAFLAIVGLGSRRTGPNIAAALAAYDSGRSTTGDVVISITAGDSTDRYRATLHEDGHEDWEYEFIPTGWRPEACRYPARIWRNDQGCPVLAVVDGGLVIPRYDPARTKQR